MNQKLELLRFLTEHAIGREHAIDSVDVSRLTDLTMPEASSYLHILWKEGSLCRQPVFVRKTATGKRRTTYVYWLEKSACVSEVLGRSTEISGRARFGSGRQKVYAPRMRFDASALAQVWR